MQYCSLPGVVCPPPEPWQLFICIFLVWPSLMMLAGIAIETYRHRMHTMPPWLAVLGALVLLSHHPVGLAIQLGAYMQFYAYAPLGASLLVTAYGLSGLWAFWYFVIGPEVWAGIRQR